MILLALVHVLGDDDILRLLQHALALDQKFRDHAGDLAAVLEHRLGEFTHQPDGAAAIDQPDVIFGQDFSEFARGLDEGGVFAGAGAAIDTDGSK